MKVDKLKIAIAEDDPRALFYLVNFFENRQEFEVVATCQLKSEVRDILNTHSIDILLADIQLMDGNIFEVLEELETFTCKIIFITAYDNYALKAIKLSAVDYILKPFNEDELKKALDKTLTDKNNSNLGSKLIDKILLPSINEYYVIDIQDIIYCEADGSYTILHSLKNDFTSSKRLNYYENLLIQRNYPFIRIHNKYIVNINHVVSIIKEGGGQIKLKNNIQLPISRNRRKEIFNMFLK